MGDWPRQPEEQGFGMDVISIAHPWALGPVWRLYGTNVPTSQAWPASDRVLMWPFRVPRPVTIYQIGVGCGATATGNYDAGIYDEFGNKIVSTGTKAKASSAEDFVNITDTTLGQGLYWAALQASAVANYIIVAAANTGLAKAMGIRQATPGSFGLPNSITFETTVNTQIPVCLGLWMRSTT